MPRLSRALLAAVAVSLCAPSVHAQTTLAGRVFNPRVNPANPDLVAYETLNGDRQDLMIRRIGDGKVFPAIARPAAPTALMALPGLSESTSLSAYSGDVDWRPRIDADRRQWFAYAASEQGGVRLYVNYVDQYGDLATGAPIAIPYAGSARQPRWSPDGRHLAFVSDSAVLHVVWNVDRALRAASGTGMRAVRIAESGNGVLFPAWAPRGLTIAYQVERPARGARRLRIETLTFDTISFAARGTPTSITDDLTDGNAVRPSWSLDGRYVAFYVDRTPVGTTGPASGALDIAVTEVQVQPSTGRILGGSLLSGLSRRLAEAVLVNNSRGPAWTRMMVGADPRPAILYVQRDEARGNPMFVHSLDAWTARRSREDSRVELSRVLKTVNHREASVTESRGFVRYVYASVQDGGEVLHVYNDSTATWAAGVPPVRPEARPLASTPPTGNNPPVTTRPAAAPPEPKAPKVPKASSGGQSVGLAVLFPGAGQFKGGAKVRGTLYTLAGVGGAGLALSALGGISSAADAGLKATDRAAYDAAKSDHASKTSMVMMGAGIAGAAWLAGVIDAAMHKGGGATSVSVVSPSAPSGPTLGLQLNLGRSTRANRNDP